MQGNELDLINSRFINDPLISLEKCLNKFTFFPVQQQRINDLQRMFSQSRILTKELIDVDLLTEVIPPSLMKVQLLFQHSTEAALAKRDYERWEYLNA